MKDEQDEKERKEREAEEKKAKEEEDKKKSEEEDEEEEEEEEVGPSSLSLFEAPSTLRWINLKTQFYFLWLGLSSTLCHEQCFFRAVFKLEKFENLGLVF